MRKKVFTILLQVTLLALAVGAVSPATNAVAQSNYRQASACEEASSYLVGQLAEFPEIMELIEETCDFRVRMNNINENVSRFDRRFIESAIATNMLELQTLEYALPRTTDEELRGLIEMMIVMHTADLEMALEVAEKIGAETEPDLTDVRVYPQTPLYDLGVRRMDLVARYLDPLMSTPGGGTATPIPTGSPTVLPTLPTGTGTIVPSRTPTSQVTNTPVMTQTNTQAATGTATEVATGTSTPAATGTATEAATGTNTPAVTGTVTGVATETGTPGVTGTVVTTATVTSVATGTGTVNPTGTVTLVPTLTGTSIPTGSPTIAPTGTSTTTPTVIAPPRPDFDLLAVHVLEDEHVMQMETALAAQRLVENNEIRAFAKHSADVAKLHLLLLNHLKYRLAHDITLPVPEFEEDYQSPRRFQPLGEDE